MDPGPGAGSLRPTRLGDCRRQGRLAVIDVPDGADVQVGLGAAVDVVRAVLAVRPACTRRWGWLIGP